MSKAPKVFIFPYFNFLQYRIVERVNDYPNHSSYKIAEGSAQIFLYFENLTRPWSRPVMQKQAGREVIRRSDEAFFFSFRSTNKGEYLTSYQNGVNPSAIGGTVVGSETLKVGSNIYRG